MYDKESGLYYMNARYYDPDIGTFMTTDPAMSSLNHYAYASANPIKYTDPTGMVSKLANNFNDLFEICMNIIGNMQPYSQIDLWDCDIFVQTALSELGYDIRNEWGDAFWTDCAGHADKLGDYLSDTPLEGWSVFISDHGELGKHSGLVFVNDDGLVMVIDNSNENSKKNGLGVDWVPYDSIEEFEENFMSGTGLSFSYWNHNDWDFADKDKSIQEHLPVINLIDSVIIDDVMDSLTQSIIDNNLDISSIVGTCHTVTINLNDNEANSTSDDSSSVICTELFKQGLMDKNIFQADQEFGKILNKKNPYIMVGYHFWAKPVVKIMQKSKIITNIVSKVALPWAEEMAYQIEKQDKGNKFGKIIMKIGIPLCCFIGIIVNNIDKIQILILSIIIYCFYFIIKRKNKKIRSITE